MSKFIFLVTYIVLFFVLSIVSYYYNGSIYLANDELKFGLIASGEINYTIEKILRSTSDFYIYYYTARYMYDVFSIDPYLFYKSSSFIFGIICALKMFDIAKLTKIDSNLVAVVMLLPITLFFFYSGVRDSWVTLCYVLFVYYSIKEKKLPIIIVILVIFGLRPESLIAIIIYYIARMRFPQRKIVYILLIVTFFVLLILFSDSIPYINSNEGGVTSAIRKLPIILEIFFLGSFNLMGGFPHISTVELSSYREFLEHGVYFKNQEFAFIKFLKLIGIYVQTALYPVAILFFINRVRAKFNGEISRVDDFFIASFISIFLYGFFSIEQGKLSSFLPIINLCVLNYYYHRFWKLLPYMLLFMTFSLGASFYAFT